MLEKPHGFLRIVGERIGENTGMLTLLLAQAIDTIQTL